MRGGVSLIRNKFIKRKNRVLCASIVPLLETPTAALGHGLQCPGKPITCSLLLPDLSQWI